MLDKKTFARGLQLINAILSKNSQIVSEDSIEAYYFLLKDLPPNEYLRGITNLMKDWTNPHYIPGPGEIKKYVELEMFGGLSKEDFILVAKAYKQTGKRISNEKIQIALDNNNVDLLLLENEKKTYIS
jgi:hypothetical protein